MAKEKVQKDKQRSSKLKIKQQKPTKTGVNSGAPEGYAVPAPLVAHVLLILLQTQ
jgi:hypothetical protein